MRQEPRERRERERAPIQPSNLRRSFFNRPQPRQLLILKSDTQSRPPPEKKTAGERRRRHTPESFYFRRHPRTDREKLLVAAPHTQLLLEMLRARTDRGRGMCHAPCPRTQKKNHNQKILGIFIFPHFPAGRCFSSSLSLPMQGHACAAATCGFP